MTLLFFLATVFCAWFGFARIGQIMLLWMYSRQRWPNKDHAVAKMQNLTAIFAAVTIYFFFRG